MPKDQLRRLQRTRTQLLIDDTTSWQDDYEAVVLRWHTHNAAKFPPGCAGREVNGQVLAILDSDVAMLVMKFVNKATLSDGGASILKKHAEIIRSALPRLRGRSRSYFAELVEIADEAVRLASIRALNLPYLIP